MRETLPVTVNRGATHAIDVATAFEAADTFAIRLETDGAPAHVHLHLDDDLSTVATLESNNHYVDGVREVTVDVAGGDRPVNGKLKLVTGYGTNAEYVDVEIVEPVRGTHYVDVDEGLSAPRERPVEPERSPLAGLAPLAALGGFALVLAVLAASFAESAAVLVGVAAVALAIAVSFRLLR